MLSPESQEWKDLMSYMQLQELKPDSADAALIQSLHTTAERYLTGADTTDPLYSQAIRCMVLDWFDNRGSGSGGSESSLSVGVRQIINQLKTRASLEGLP